MGHLRHCGLAGVCGRKPLRQHSVLLHCSTALAKVAWRCAGLRRKAAREIGRACEAKLCRDFVYGGACFAQKNASFIVYAVAQQRQRGFAACLIAAACQMCCGHAQCRRIVRHAVVLAVVPFNQIGERRHKPSRTGFGPRCVGVGRCLIQLPIKENRKQAKVIVCCA